MRPYRRQLLRGLASAVGTAVLLFCSIVWAQKNADKALPLVRIKLYETGVGYFERRGPLKGVTQLPIPAPHLDDALNSLVIWNDEGGAHITGMSFASTVTEDRRRALAGLPMQGAGSLRFDDILDGMRGARVRLEAKGRTYQGRLLTTLVGDASGYRLCTRAKDDEAQIVDRDCVDAEESVIAIISDNAEVLRFIARDVTSIRPLDKMDSDRLAMAAHVPSRAEQQLRVAGASDGPVTLGYVTETPVWRATYRAILPAAGKGRALLRAWALIHNDTDEHWKNVGVELVSGQPDSFLFPFSAPRYSHRRLVTPQQDLPSVRQLGSQGADDMWDHDGLGYGSGAGFGGIGLGSTGISGRGGGMGVGQGKAESSLLSIGDIAGMAVAEGQGVGALYRYDLADSVDLAPHHSALLPLLSEAVAMDRVTVFKSAGQPGQSLLVMKNETHQTLPAGVLSVFQAGAFAGETALPRLSAGETGRVAFGLDLDVELEQTRETEVELPKLYRYVHAEDEEERLLERHYVRRTATSYHLWNRSGEDREVQIRFRLVNNSRVEGADAVNTVRKDGGTYAIFRIKAGAQREIDVIREEGLEDRHLDLTTRTLAKLANAGSLPEEQRRALSKVVTAKRELARRKKKRAGLSRVIKRRNRDIQRVRDDLESVRFVNKRTARRVAESLVVLRKEVDAISARRARIGIASQQAAVASAWDELNRLSE